MPRQKDLKRVVRARMEKTGESYTAARLQIVRRKRNAPNYSELAGMSDASVQTATGRDWTQWVAVLDAAGCADKPHREIARYAASLGIGSWWSQSVAVGYERIRGRRVIGQRCDGDFEANKSRTFAVPVARVYDAFSNEATRSRWFPEKVTISGATARKRMRIRMEDNTIVEIGFLAKNAAKCAVAIQHSKLPDKATAAKLKVWWAERLDALGEVLESPVRTRKLD